MKSIMTIYISSFVTYLYPLPVMSQYEINVPNPFGICENDLYNEYAGPNI